MKATLKFEKTYLKIYSSVMQRLCDLSLFMHFLGNIYIYIYLYQNSEKDKKNSRYCIILCIEPDWMYKVIYFIFAECVKMNNIISKLRQRTKEQQLTYSQHMQKQLENKKMWCLCNLVDVCVRECKRKRRTRNERDGINFRTICAFHNMRHFFLLFE